MNSKFLRTVVHSLMRLVLSALLVGNGALRAANAAEPNSWRDTLETFSSEVKFQEALEAFIEASPGGPQTGAAMDILRHLQMTGLRYTSIDDLMRQIVDQLRSEPNSALIQEHLEWIRRVLTEMVEIAPRSPSVKRAMAQVEALLNSTTASFPKETLMNLIRSEIGSRALERLTIEASVGLPLDNPGFPDAAYRKAMDGDLTDSLKRLKLGPYINLRQLFTPTIQQSKAASIRYAPSGDQGMQLRRARRYANPSNFVRNGWSQDDDMLRVATGDMIERVYERPDAIPTPSRNPQVERNILFCVDGTSSMNLDGRGALRNLIVQSSIDKIFTQAQLRKEKVVVYVIIYANKVKSLVKISSLEEAAALYDSLGQNEFSIGSSAEHATAIVQGIQEVLKSPDKITHLNVVLLTDGEEAVDTKEIKTYTDKLTAGPDGLRLGISAISLVSGQKMVNQTIREISQTDSRFTDHNPPMQFFDIDAVTQWTGRNWMKTFASSLGQPVWTVKPENLGGLSESLRRLDLREIEIPTHAARFGPHGNDFGDTGDGESGPGGSAKGQQTGEAQAPEGSDPSGASASAEGSGEESENEKSAATKVPEETLENELKPSNITADQEADKTPRYRINALRGPMPGFLAVTQAANLPPSLASGVANATQRRDLVQVRIIEPLTSYDLELESLIASKLTNGISALAKLEGYALAGLKITDRNGNEIRDFQAFEITRNGLYILNFGKRVARNQRFFYKAYYVRELNQAKRSPLFDNLDRESLKKVSELIYLDDLKRTASTVRRLADKRGAIKIEDLNKSIKLDAIYTFKPELTTPPTTNGRFAKYQKFLTEGVLHYQCNGANPLLADTVQSYAESSGQKDLFAENVSGYAVTDATITAGAGHAVTFVSDNRLPYSYLKLDATPSKKDDSAPPPSSGNPVSQLWRKLRDRYWHVSESMAAPIRRRYEAKLANSTCGAALSSGKVTPKP